MRGTFLTIALFLVAALAGCSGGGDGEGSETTSLASGKGAISGLVIDDVYRPIPGALVLVQGVGLTATTDANGQFTLMDLTPDSYLLVASADRHEAAPVNVDIQAGAYSEVEILARRIFSTDGVIITTQYSVFVPCAVSAVVITANDDCTQDTSGDSFRSGFNSNYTGYKDATYLVTEMKANQKASSETGAYKVVVREQGDGDYWASKFTIDGDYLKLTMRKGNISTDDTEARNVKWDNKKKMETLLFPQGSLKGETQTGLNATCAVTPITCGESRGLGPRVGIKANFIQSLFLGPPQVSIAEYHVLSPSP